MRHNTVHATQYSTCDTQYDPIGLYSTCDRIVSHVLNIVELYVTHVLYNQIELHTVYINNIVELYNSYII